MPSKSKAKGNSWEYQLCDHLSNIFNLMHTRVPTSGAIFTNAIINKGKKFSNTQLLLTEGDIIPPDELKNIKYECKNYQSLEFHQILTGSCKLLDTWIEQAKSDKIWFLAIKITRKGSFVLFDSDRFNYIIPESFLHYKHYTIVSLDGFFEKNKDNILKLNGTPSTTTPTLSS